MVFAENSNPEDLIYGIVTSTNIPLLHIILGTLNFILPFSIIQKILLFLIFFLSGISMYKLVNTKKRLPKYFAGLFYMINPFVYVRFMAGHWNLLLGYAILPFVIKSIMNFLEKPSKKQLIKTCLIITLIGIISIHMLGLSLFVFLIFFIFKFKKSLVKPILFLSLFFILLNSFWIIPLLTSQDNTLIQEIGDKDISVFATETNPINSMFNTASLYGFWRERAYALPKNIIPLPIYVLLFGVILYLTIQGYIYSKDNYKGPLLTVTILAFILAVGITYPLFKPVFLFLFNKLIFMKIFREPQKFVILIALFYAYFSAKGIEYFLKNSERQVKTALILVLFLPLIYTPTMFGSFWGQLHTIDYPKDWYEVNNLLNQDKEDFNVLFLPWHGYLDFRFIPNQDKRIANPSKAFFDKPIIKSDDIELGALKEHTTDPVLFYVGNLLRDKENTEEKLKLINVKYVIIAKEIDYKNHLWMLNETGLELVKETDNLYLLKNPLETNKFYQSDDLEGLEPLNYEKESKIKYVIEKPSKKYVVFTDSFNSNWRLGKQEPKILETVNYYEYDGENTIKFTRFRIYLIGYIISGIIFIFLLYLFFKKRKSNQ